MAPLILMLLYSAPHSIEEKTNIDLDSDGAQHNIRDSAPNVPNSIEPDPFDAFTRFFRRSSPLDAFVRRSLRNRGIESAIP